MKTIRLLTVVSLLLLVNHTTRAQWVSVPDTNFGKWLNTNGYSQCLQGNSTTGWQMDTTCNAVVTAVDMYCSDSHIKDLTGIQYFDSLTFLECGGNLLVTLPPLPPMLVSLYCYSNKLTTLPVLPNTISLLDCPYNYITVLPSLPAGLKGLDCKNNFITVLPPLPAGLQSLDISDCPITTFPTLPASLKSLYCYQCNINALPTLPPTLKFLHCSNNSLTVIPTLPNTLQSLYCSYNLLPGLPALPDSLILLSCDSNLLTSLPNLPGSLERLNCSHNSISVLPAIPSRLEVLHCAFNNISSLPEISDTLDILDVRDNPLLTCLPNLKNLTVILFLNTGVSCVPNYPLYVSSSMPSIETVPLCEYPNANNCPVYWNITGRVYNDSNSDCTYNTPDSVLRNVAVQLWQNGTLLKTDLIGQERAYYFDVTSYSAYQITIDTSGIPFRILCPDTGSLTSVIDATDSFDTNLDFALECKPGFDLAARSVSTTQAFRPAGFTTLEVAAGDASNFYNAHCAGGTAGNVILSYTGPVKYVSPANGALTPTSVSNNTLTWSVADFGTVNFFEDFDVVMQTDTSAQIGQQVCFTLTASPIINDNNPANNTLTMCFPIVNSYDPNDKTAYPAGNIDTLQRDLVYTVRFQNTGNAEAQHIYITDTLDANVRPETFELLAYSHQPMVQIDGNAVRFNFANINLPDSFSNEPASHGYVQYRVKLKENLPIGTVINNTAFIYFDFNAPVITNTATNTVSVEVDTTVGIRPVKNNPEVFVYPNPANKAVTVTVSEGMTNASVTVTDMLGRMAIEPVWLNNTRTISLNTQTLSEGVYMVNVSSKEGTTVTRRLIVNH